MAESKFLRYQDPSGDGLIDECDVFVEVAEVPCEECKCVRNGAAITPNWRNLDDEDAYLNEKICMYQVFIQTEYESTLRDDADVLEERYEEYADQAVKALLTAFNKNTSSDTLQTVKDVLEYTDWDLPARPRSHLALLYSIPHITFCNIENADDDEDSDEDDEESDASGTDVTYTISDLKTKLIRIRKGLHLYAAYAKAGRFIDGANLYKQDGNTRVTFYLKDYGDWGLPGASIMAKILPRLDKFLNTKGKNIRGVAGGGFKSMFGDTVEKITITFGEEYELKKLTVYTVECGEKPIKYFKKNTLGQLTKKNSPWGDPTAMAYLAKLDEMEADLTAREPMPWLEFVKKHTYPEIFSDVNQGYTNTDPEKSAGSCIAEKLQEEGKQLGQDIFDATFSIGDALAYKFSDNLCRETPEEVLEDKIKIGIIQDPNIDASKAIEQMALEQAYQTLEQDDAVFDEFCAQAINNSFGGIDGIENFFESIGKIKLCGLHDLLIDAIGCLLGEFSLEETLSTIVKSSMQAMSLENFGNLFIGLPPEKQAELDALVKKKFENGEFFKEGSVNQQTSDVLAGKLDYTKPWEDEEQVQAQKEEQMQPSATGETETATTIEAPSSGSTRTLAQQFDGSAAKKELSPNIVFEAYILAIIEVYSDNYFELMEELNKFPGAQLVAGLIAAVDCPKPPLIEPSTLDWVKDKELPFCRNINSVRLPIIDNPLAWVPSVPDLAGIFFEAAKEVIQEALFNILMTLMVKVCETLGNATCGALGQVGNLAKAALPDGERKKIADIFSESICGDDVPSEQIDNTIVDMFADLGLGAAALADTEQVLNFAADISGATSRLELSNAFLGNVSGQFGKVVSTLVKFEYPDFEPALGTEEAVRSFFEGMGNLMPADFRDQLRDFAEGLPEDDMAPANPSLCATEDQIEQFCELRSEILGARCTEEQLTKLCERPLEDLEDLVNALQSGPTPDLPPLFSAPGCDDGLIPYETEEAAATATTAMNGMLEQLKVDFAYDMLGNGPGEGKWGLINMILSDTMGNPYTAHARKAGNRRTWVDFYVDPASTDSSDSGIFPDPPRLNNQKGAFPYKVAAWLQDYITTQEDGENRIWGDSGVKFVSNNELLEDVRILQSFEDAGITTFGGKLDLLKLPDLGYNTEVKLDNESVVYVEKARKAAPDLTLYFQDNSKGISEQDAFYAYGFNLEFYLSDLTSGAQGLDQNRFDDNVRIKITDRLNFKSDVNTTIASVAPPIPKAVLMGALNLKNQEVEETPDRKFEFLAVDNTLEEIDLDDYPKFLSAFTTKHAYLPQIILLDEMIGAGTVIKSDIKSSYDSIMSSITQKFIDEIAGNDDAFLYGATFDNLSFEDVEYVIAEPLSEDDGYEDDYPAGTNYYDVKINVPVTDPLILIFKLGWRPLLNKDQILGISKMQFENPDNNRVLYLDPNTFGGSYVNPPLYIKPLENKGWLGFMDVIFPDLSPCKPYRTDLIDFEEIQQKVENSYPTIPEDERLKSDPDCIVEKPYARILGRAAKSGLESIITAAIKIYVSAFFIKSMATFTKFYPKFPDTFSNIYAAYLVEEMEASFKDAQKAVWEAFNPFKDNEFWYAFLEQSVQLYSRRVDSGDISDPPPSVIAALVRLNDAQERYHYSYRKDVGEDREAGEIGQLDYIGKWGLKNYRQQKNLEAIQETEEDAKLVMKELVVEQLNIMGEKFIENLKIVDMSPSVYDLDYYLLQDLSQGGESLTLDQEIKEEHADFAEYSASSPSSNDGYYTNGGEFALPDGTTYIGYYHLGIESGITTYITGEFGGRNVTGETLTPFASKITVPIGDISELGVDVDTTDTSKPFVIEKYISVNGSPEPPSSAVSTITSVSDQAQNISDVYPGTLEMVTNNNGRVVGLDGELGVRHGLRFSVIINGAQYTITEVEVDALDRPLAQIDPLEGDSKLLLCLINKLKEDDKFKLIAQYVFPLKKITAMMAIYNGLAFLPSIGEKVATEDPTYTENSPSDWKPGVAASFDEDTGVAAVSSSGEEGAWESKIERDPGPFGGLFVREWDNWDQTLLRNSKSRIKKIFKSYYNSRDFDPSNAGDSSDSGGTVITNEFKSRFKVKPGQNLLPFWKKRMLRTNPFNADGEMCEKKD